MAIFLCFFALGFQPVEVVNPIGFQEVNQEDDGAEAPGDGICPGNSGKLVDEFDGDGDIGDADDAPANKHGDHGNRSLACAAHNGGDTVGKCQQEIEQADGPHVHGAEVDGQFVAGEKSYELGCQHIFRNTDELRHQAGAKNTEANAFFHAVIIFGTQILTNERGQSHGETGDGQKGETFDLLMGTTAGHGCVTEGVDVGLHHQIGKADDGILNTGRQAELNDGFQKSGIEPNFTKPQAIFLRNTPHQTETAEQGADTLGNGGGQSCGTDTEAEITNQQKVQADVNKGRKNQVVQGVLAVTDGVENAHKDVVHHGEEHTVGIVPEIGNGLGKNRIGRLHPAQNGGREYNAQHRQQDTGRQTESHIRVHGPLQGIVVLGTETFGDEHTGTHGNALEETHHHVDQAGRGTDCRQGGIAQISAHDPGVESVIKLLKKIAQENGKCEQQDFYPDGTFCQILAGSMGLVMMIVKSVAAEWHIYYFLK